jgi:hypothetical protein
MADGYYKYEASGQIPLRESFWTSARTLGAD